MVSSFDILMLVLAIVSIYYLVYTIVDYYVRWDYHHKREKERKRNARRPSTIQPPKPPETWDYPKDNGRAPENLAHSWVDYTDPFLDGGEGTLIVVDTVKVASYLPYLLRHVKGPVEVADFVNVTHAPGPFRRLANAVQAAAEKHGSVRFMTDAPHHEHKSIRFTDSVDRKYTHGYQAAVAEALLSSRFERCRVMRADTLPLENFGTDEEAHLYPAIAGASSRHFNTAMFHVDRKSLGASQLKWQARLAEENKWNIFESFNRHVQEQNLVRGGLPRVLVAPVNHVMHGSVYSGTHVTLVSEDERSIYYNLDDLVLDPEVLQDRKAYHHENRKPLDYMLKYRLKQCIEEAWSLRQEPSTQLNIGRKWWVSPTSKAPSHSYCDVQPDGTLRCSATPPSCIPGLERSEAPKPVPMATEEELAAVVEATEKGCCCIKRDGCECIAKCGCFSSGDAKRLRCKQRGCKRFGCNTTSSCTCTMEPGSYDNGHCACADGEVCICGPYGPDLTNDEEEEDDAGAAA